MLVASYGTRPAYEAARALAFAAIYVLVLVVAIYVVQDPGDDDAEAGFWLLLAFQPLFGFALARWWGFLLAPLAILASIPAGTPVSDEGWEILPLWFGMIIWTPVLAVLVLLGFLGRSAWNRWGGR
jgi:hypothetical protein